MKTIYLLDTITYLDTLSKSDKDAENHLLSISEKGAKLKESNSGIKYLIIEQ